MTGSTPTSDSPQTRAQQLLDALLERVDGAADGRIQISRDDLADYYAVPLAGVSAERLAVFGVTLHGEPGPGDRLLLGNPDERQAFTLTLGKSRDCCLIVAAGARLRGHLSLEGEGHLVYVGGGADGDRHCRTATLRGTQNHLLIGRGGDFEQLDLAVGGERQGITIGDDAAIGSRVRIRATDSHGLIDLNGGGVVNPPAAVRIEAHVWLQSDVVVGAGVSLGEGSVVLEGSKVMRSVPPRSVVDGTAGDLVASGRSWTRDANPTAEAARSVLFKLDGQPPQTPQTSR